MPFLIEEYFKIKQELNPSQTQLIAVSKTKPNEDILEAYNAGVRDFGENYVQELIDKQSALPKDIHWHFIGHLQSNKVKYIAPFVNLIHGVDSEKLLLEINKQGQKIGRKINCLLQVHIAKEESKFGFNEEELNSLIQKYFSSSPSNNIKLDFINIQGLMGMATFTHDNSVIESEFLYLKVIFDKIQTFKGSNFNPVILSMGMSSDYLLAIKNGSNMVRIGSMLFGNRN
jgi:pyridoxal phosphate enzyme (YggS family)